MKKTAQQKTNDRVFAAMILIDEAIKDLGLNPSSAFREVKRRMQLTEYECDCLFESYYIAAKSYAKI